MSTQDRMPRILVTEEMPDEAISLLEQVGEVDRQPGLSRPALMERLPHYEAFITGGQRIIDAELIHKATNCRVIGRIGAGLENIDVVAARERHIQVVNTPGVQTLAVAEHTFGLMLAIARQLPQAQKALQAGSRPASSLTGTGLAGKTLGIIGYGRIGREVALRARAFGMRLLVNQRRPTPELDMEGIESVDLRDLLQRADFVTIHVPHRPETIGLLGPNEIQQMKKGAFLINTARTEIVDEAALLDALNRGQIAGAALDVHGEETAVNPALIKHERVIATPHIGARTADAQREAAISTAEQVAEILQQISIENILPLKVVPMDKIFPHESIDQKRVDRLAARLEAEGVLGNPPIVTQVDDKYMVLDGATRTAAMKKLGFPHAIVQVSSSEDGLDLHTWYHVVRKIDLARLLAILEAMPDIFLVPVDPEKAADDMFAYGAMCYLHTVDDRAYLVQPAAGVNRLDALNHLTETYIEAATVDRTLDRDIHLLRAEYPDLTTLVVFPAYSVAQVMQVTISGRYFPAGITRFVIPGRILRLNADLSVLRSDKPLHEKNRWLNQLLEEKLRQNAIRFYREPVYLLDE